MAKHTPPKGYDLERFFFNLIADNEVVSGALCAYHSSLHRYLLFLCNKHQWKNPLDVHTPEAMKFSGIGSYTTYKKALGDLEKWGLIVWLYRTNNQWRSNKVHINFEAISPEQADKLAQEYQNALQISTKQLQSTLKAHSKQLQSTYEAGTCTLNNKNTINNLNTTNNLNSPKKKDGEISLEMVISYFNTNKWSEELAKEYFTTYAPDWQYNGEPIVSWRAFAKAFIANRPQQQKQYTNRGETPPKNFFST